MAPPALLDTSPPIDERRTAGPQPRTVSSARVPDLGAPRPSADKAPARAAAPAGDVYLKQNGQIYAVKDWETLHRWIGERRIERSDLVSEGGVRWEPVDSRPDLAALFDAGDSKATPRPPVTATFPFSADTPFGAPTQAEVWTDEDTEGIPVGLPPLPTEEHPRPFVAPESRAPDSVVRYEPTVEEVDEDDDEVAQPVDDGDDDVPEEDTDEDPRAPVPVSAMVAEEDPTPIPVSRARPLGRGVTPASQPPRSVDSAPGEMAFDAEWAQELEPSGNRGALLAGAGLLTFSAVVAIGLWVVWPRIRAVEAPPPPAPVVAPRPPAPVVAPPAPAPAPAPVPEPVAAPAPPPAPPPMEEEAYAKLLERAWDLADSDRPKAETLFKRALTEKPGDPEAEYGYGYVLLFQGKKDAAAPHLCAARKATDAEIRQDASGLVTTHELRCP